MVKFIIVLTFFYSAGGRMTTNEQDLSGLLDHWFGWKPYGAEL